jgi:inorganic pyrophosphatase
MNLNRVTPGKHIPDEINAIIEIPAHCDPEKYEVDKETSAIFVDRFMSRGRTSGDLLQHRAL